MEACTRCSRFRQVLQGFDRRMANVIADKVNVSPALGQATPPLRGGVKIGRKNQLEGRPLPAPEGLRCSAPAAKRVRPMNGESSFPLPLPLARLVDSLCDRFEEAWKTGRQPRLEEYLIGVPGPARPALARE